MKKELMCALCPNSCFLEIDLDEKRVIGNSCNKGKYFAITEISCPERVVTTVIRVTGKEEKMLPVKTSKKISKGLVFECIKEINKIKVNFPVKVGDVLLHNVLFTGADVVATANI